MWENLKNHSHIHLMKIDKKTKLLFAVGQGKNKKVKEVKQIKIVFTFQKRFAGF